ncbi:MAG: hypothetical protein AB7S81_05315 [Bdellovibrionales bacterium]
MAIIITAIMTIIPTKQDRFLRFWLAGLALVLLVLAVPSLIARLKMLPGNDIREKLLVQEKVTPTDLQKLEGTRRDVVEWFADKSVLSDLAMIAEERFRSNPEDKPLFVAAKEWQERSLKDAPADAYGWFRLSFLYYHEDKAVSERAVQAWVNSLRAAPYEPRLTLARLDLGMRFRDKLDDVSLLYLPTLMREQALLSADELARIALRGRYVSEVEAALEGASSLTDFRAAVSKRLRSVSQGVAVRNAVRPALSTSNPE